MAQTGDWPLWVDFLKTIHSCLQIKWSIFLLNLFQIDNKIFNMKIKAKYCMAPELFDLSLSK